MSSKDTVVLVTGGTGFIGAHCIKVLLDQGFTVKTTVRDLASSKNEFLRTHVATNEEQNSRLSIVQATLTDSAGWDDAVRGCTYVLHVASPVPVQVPKTHEEVIGPAVSGAKLVLEACRKVGGVKRVVLTSSIAAVAEASMVQPGRPPFNESDWTIPDKVEGGFAAYIKSKAIAEKTAWDFVSSLAANEKFELATICPSLVLGPVLADHHKSSPIGVLKMMNRDFPMVPNIWWNIVDVRDVARAHVAAMTVPEAAGERFILSCAGIWYKEKARILADEFNPMGYSVPTSSMPSWVLTIAGWFDKEAFLAKSMVDIVRNYDGSKARKILLDGHYISVKEAIVTCGHSLIEVGSVERKEGYRQAQ